MKPYERTLVLGDSGELVSDLQKKLNELGFNECVISGTIFDKIEEDGNFGEITKGCLTEFQLKVLETIDKSGVEEIIKLKNEHQITLGDFDYYTWYVMNSFEDLCSKYKIECYANDYSYVEPETPLEPPKIPGTQSIFTELVSKEQMKAILGCSNATVDKHYEALNKTLFDYSINTPLRIVHFLAQIGHESCGLKYLEEIASGKAYEGRADLGNIYPGDGKKFKGRSPLQITGRHNYTMYFNSIGRPELIETPEILSTDMLLMWGATAWYWKTRKLNKYADMDNVRALTLRVNGGYNGLNDRIGYLNKGKKVFGI